IAIVLVLGVVAAIIQGDDEEVTKEEKPKEVEESEEVGELDEKVEVNETIELNDTTIVIQSLKVTDDKTQLYGYWNHTSKYDEAHLDLLVTTVIEQDGKELEVTNSDKLLEQKKKTIDGSFDLNIERSNNNPITIKLIANTDEQETESITMDIP